MKANNAPYVTAIILAAGSGSRMNSSVPKQRLTINGESILRHTARAFEKSREIDSIVVVSREDEIEWATNELKNDFGKVHAIVCGGKNRAESACKGFYAIDSHTDFVAIHDGARCLVTDEIIDNVVRAAYVHSAASAMHSVSDTLKKVGDSGFVNATISREGMYAAQTPQVFSRELYARAMEGLRPDETITDDNMLVERIGEKVFAVEAGRENIKVTTPEDVGYAEYVLKRRHDMSGFRIGHGYDVHRLVEGRRLVIGGVDIPHTLGLLGHSDADVLTHAAMDALLGAAGLGDIGRHFPDTDGQYKDVSSLRLLDRVAALIAEKGYYVENIDVTLVAQRPKISPYINEMIANVSKTLNIDCGRVNIKATTEERLGFTGSEEGISCHAVALIKNKG